MNIEQAKSILTRQKVSKRTPSGRTVHDLAIEGIDAVLSDEANYGMEVVECKGCGFVISILMTEAGCPNCGVEDLSTDITE